MQRRWILVGSVIAVVAVALVVGQALLNGRTASTPHGPTTETVTRSGATAPPSASSPTSGSAVASLPATAPPIQPMPKRLNPVPARRPVSAPDALHPLSASPPGIISGYSVDKLPSSSAYAISFLPWGYGPPSPYGPTVAVTIISAASIGAAPNGSGLKNMVMLLVMDRGNGGTVYGGGKHRGVLTFVAHGTTLFPTLNGVVAPNP